MTTTLKKILALHASISYTSADWPRERTLELSFTYSPLYHAAIKMTLLEHCQQPLFLVCNHFLLDMIKGKGTKKKTELLGSHQDYSLLDSKENH